MLPMPNRAPSLPPMNLTAKGPMTLAAFPSHGKSGRNCVTNLTASSSSQWQAEASPTPPSNAILRWRSEAAWGESLASLFGSDLKIQAAENSSRYPDGMVICSGLDPALKIVRNPVVVFEVLSPSAAAVDRIVKAREYQATPSVQRYVMLEQARLALPFISAPRTDGTSSS